MQEFCQELYCPVVVVEMLIVVAAVVVVEMLIVVAVIVVVV